MHDLEERKKITIMIAIMISLFFAMINQTIVGTATPRIIAQLGGMEYYSWIITVFMLTASIATILVGKMSDIYGRKPFIIIGLIVFIIGSFLAGTSTNIFQLIVYRGIQGAGSGVIMSTSFIAVGDLYSPRERGKWQGIMSGIFGLSSILGPVLGGFIVDHFSWRWVFWVFLPFGLVALAVIWKLFPSVKKQENQSVDYLGSIFISLTIIPLLLAFSWAGQKYPWGSAQIIGLFTWAAIALGIFLYVEYRAQNPTIPLFLFKNSVFTVSNIVSFIINAGMMGAVIYIPYFIQGVLGESASYSSYLMIPMTISVVIGSAIAGQWMTKTGKYKKLAISGLLIAVIGMFLLSRMNIHTSFATIIVNNIVLGAGLGLTMPVFSLTVQNAVEHRLLGAATAATSLFRSLGGTIGIAVMSTIMTHRMSLMIEENMDEMQAGSGVALEGAGAKLSDAIDNPEFVMDPDKLATLHASLPPELQTVLMEMVQIIRESMGYAISGVFVLGSIVLIFAIFTTFFLKEVPLRKNVKMESELENEQKKPVIEP